ncbi:MAG: DUF1801 domain-containing protein [Acidobacteria bacterium]|nr:DUF1801 domain-containing protein [Acidobacteriota bacterium]MBS1864567.1 DUF1801 domain-containing protein [Acidobacteriota bacterium]
MPEVRNAGAAIDLYVARENPALVHVVDALRDLVKKTIPQATEAMNPWGIPVMELNGALCYIRVGKKHVTFGFPRGSAMKDPGKLLEGDGRNLRHVKVFDVAQARDPNLRGLLAQAKTLNAKTPLSASLRPKDQLKRKKNKTSVSRIQQSKWENLA